MNEANNKHITEPGSMSDTSGDPAFTAESVLVLVTAHVLRETGPLSSLRRPSNDALAELAEKLDRHRILYRELNGSSKNLEKIQARIEQAMSELLTLLPEYVDRIKIPFERDEVEFGCVDLPLSPNNAILLDDIDARQSLVDVLSAIRKTCAYKEQLRPTSSYFPPYAKWRDLADRIAENLREAMRSTNPDAVLGRSNDGPVPRFVAAVLPTITGDGPTPVNVGKHLKEIAVANRDTSPS